MLSKTTRRKQSKAPRSKEWIAPLRDLALRMGHVFRFANSSGATNVSIQIKDLLGLVVCATAATTATSLLCAIKIKSLTIRTPAGAAANAFATVEWNGSLYEAPSYKNEVALGSAEPTVLVSKPPRGSDPSYWLSQATGTSAVPMIITAPVNSVLDLACTIIFANASQLGNIAPLTYTASSGLTAGYLYYGALDRSASSKFVPVQVSTYL